MSVGLRRETHLLYRAEDLLANALSITKALGDRRGASNEVFEAHVREVRAWMHVS
ncbi:MAG: hypothetical protein Aurels2KO_19490 [Aureliella sp.]